MIRKLFNIGFVLFFFSQNLFSASVPVTLTNITPKAGPLSGGTTVTLTGTGLNEVTKVSFGNVPAVSFNSVSDTQITAVSPTGVGQVNITVTTSQGASVTSLDQFTYVDTPMVTRIFPTKGPEAGGLSVTITGVNLSKVTEVLFGATAASSFTVVDDTQINAIAPPGSGIQDITVHTTGGLSTTSTADQFTFVASPDITSIAPKTGSDAGGTLIKLTGTHFTDAAAVSFGNMGASSFTIVSDTEITVLSPPGNDATNISVTTVGGTSKSTDANLFTYRALPVITTVAPDFGFSTGGNTVTIVGTHFTGTTSVKFGSTLAPSFTVISDTELQVVSPEGEGNIDISINTPIGKNINNSSSKFSYITPPALTECSPLKGPIAGGTSVTINGVNFAKTTPVTSVMFGDKPAKFTIISDTQVVAISPAVTDIGKVDIQVTTRAGTTEKNIIHQFAYMSAPVITSISPNEGPIIGGNRVTITGRNFNETTSVTFGNTPVKAMKVMNDTRVDVVVPPGSGIVNVTVTTAGGGASEKNMASYYTYYPAPAITNLVPNNGPQGGGTTVAIYGTSFKGVNAVKFGNVPALSYVVVSDTQINAISPAGTGTVNVTISSSLGTSSASSAAKFTYFTGPRVTGVTPAIGLITGGTSVQISGMNLSRVANVLFGNKQATFKIINDNQLLAVSPPGQGVVDITVVTTGGERSMPNLAAQFTYTVALRGIFVGLENGQVYYSTDQGENWVETGPLDGSSVNGVATVDVLLYAGTDAGNVYFSMNKGLNWIAMPSPSLDRSAINTLFALNNTLYVGTESGNVYYSNQDGATWSSLTAPDGSHSPVKSLFVVSDQVLYAGTDNGSVYYSINKGRTWSAINGQPDGTAINNIFVANGKVYVVTANEFVYTSTSLAGDGTWGLPIAQVVNRLYVNADGSLMYVGTQGGDVFSLATSTELGFVTNSAIQSIWVASAP